MTHPNRSVTWRGFTTYDEFTDTYGAKVTIRESSAATRTCVWVFTEGGDTHADINGHVNDGNAHLDVEQATRLRNALDAFIKEHSNA